jgi:sugar lactone lactonase YvrE
MKQTIYAALIACTVAILFMAFKKEDGNHSVSSVSVTSFAPAAAEAGKTIVITGTGFSNVRDYNTVTFNGVVAKVTYASNTEIYAIVPKGKDCSGAVQVTVTDKNGITETNFSKTPFTYLLTYAKPEVPFVGGAHGNSDGYGTSAKFYSPKQIALDAAGNIYVADASNNRIRKITPRGSVTSINVVPAAGSTPVGIAVAPDGKNLYLSLSYSHNVYKLTDLVFGVNGANCNTRTVYESGKLNTRGYQDGRGKYELHAFGRTSQESALFNRPSQMALDSKGNLYVADYENSAVRKINSAGFVNTVGKVFSTRVEGIAIDPTEKILYVSLMDVNQIWKMNIDGSNPVLFAGSPTYGIGAEDGTGTKASFCRPSGLATDSNGNLFVADSYYGKIRRITPDGNVSTVAYGLGRVEGVAVGENNTIYVSSVEKNCIWKIRGE